MWRPLRNRHQRFHIFCPTCVREWVWEGEGEPTVTDETPCACAEQPLTIVTAIYGEASLARCQWLKLNPGDETASVGWVNKLLDKVGIGR